MSLILCYALHYLAGIAVIPLSAAAAFLCSPYATPSQARRNRLLYVAVGLAELAFRLPASCAFTTLGQSEG